MRCSLLLTLSLSILASGCGTRTGLDDKELIAQFESDVHEATMTKIRARMPAIEGELLRAYEGRLEGPSMMFGGQILGELGTEPTDRFIEKNISGSKDTNPAKALWVLSHREGAKIKRDTFAVLREKVAITDGDVKAMVCSILAADDSEPSRKIVLAYLKKAPADRLSRIINQIGERKARHYFQDLVQYLSHSDERVRNATAYALEAMDPSRAATLLNNRNR